MILIAHRGLLDGPDPALENTQQSIMNCLQQGIDVEVDVWFKNNTWYLGHDAPQYQIDFQFLCQDGMWIHTKNFPAAEQLLLKQSETQSLNFFWHDTDDRTLTSGGYWWTYMQKAVGARSIAVLPETYVSTSDLKECLSWNCAGVCTDFVNRLLLKD